MIPLSHSRDVGGILRNLRTKAELSVRQVAARAHISKSAVTKRETRPGMSVDGLIDHADALDHVLVLVHRDQLPALEATARQAPGKTPPQLVVFRDAATCHPDRPATARGLCGSCYETARRHGRLDEHPTTRRVHTTAEFAAEFELLRGDGLTRPQIAARLGITRNAVDIAYRRAVAAGLLTPDRRTA